MGQSKKTSGETRARRKEDNSKMCGQPCFRSVCGMPLQTAVYIIGLVELIITVIVTIANVVKYSKLVNEEDCEGKDVCIGPIIKYCVFDAFFGILCSILLFIGARMRHRCLLIFWILITLGCSIKYLYVFVVSDWTSLEDWVHLLPGLLHRRHLGGRRLHQGVRHHQQWRCCPRLWCSASLQGLRRSFTISVTICQSYMPSKVLRITINRIS